MAPDTPIARVPAPHANRIILTLSGAPVCVARTVIPVERGVIEEAIAAALWDQEAVSGKQIGFELVDFEAAAQPEGKLVFTAANLPKSADATGTVIWRGKLNYSEQHSVPFWVKAKLWIDDRVCVAAREVFQRSDLGTADCRLENRRFYPFGPEPIRDALALSEKVAKERIPEGQVLYRTALQRRLDVESGQQVELRVRRGTALVRLEARAITAGRAGQVVVVSNPANGKRIEGLVAGPGAVEVTLK